MSRLDGGDYADIDRYQQESRDHAVYPGIESVGGLTYAALGLAGEAGEVAEKVKKLLRDDDGVLTRERSIEIEKELGDVLWYLSMCASELGIFMSEIATDNVLKVRSRRERNSTRGEGDDR